MTQKAESFPIGDHESRTRGKHRVMRKRLITPIPQDARSRVEGRPDLDGAAVVEVTSEENNYPVEIAPLAATDLVV
jgi:hypothetical protein